MELGEMISLYRRQAGLTIDELSEKSGVPKGTINKIIGGVTKAPTLENVRSIAYALGLRLADFDDDPALSELFSPSEQKIIKKYRDLDTYGKEAVESVLDVEYRRVKDEKDEQEEADPEEDDNIIEMPLAWSKASAGTGFDLIDEESTPIKVRYNDLTRKADFCVEVDGHSMEPKIMDGDIILVRQQPSVDVGEIGLFTVNDEGFVKEQGVDRLISINPKYKDIYPGEYDTVRCCGKVVGVLDPEWIVEK